MNNFIDNYNINLYDILKVKSDASIDEIKKAYKKLSLKYHPDKHKTSGLTLEETTKIFIKISEAYEILSDEQKREKYDRQQSTKKFSANNLSEAVDEIKNLFSSKEYILFMNILDNKIKQSILNNSYTSNFFIELNQMNLINLFSYINNFKILDIEVVMYFSLKELYNNEYKKLNCKRLTKEIFKEAIYPIDKMQIYENEGEIFNINEQYHCGNFIVKIKFDFNQNYNNVSYQILDNDLYATIYKTTIINNIINLLYLDDKVYELNIKDLEKINADFGNLYLIYNMGLPYYNTNDDEIDITVCEIKRGNLFILII